MSAFKDLSCKPASDILWKVLRLAGVHYFIPRRSLNKFEVEGLLPEEKFRQSFTSEWSQCELCNSFTPEVVLDTISYVEGPINQVTLDYPTFVDGISCLDPS